MIGQETANMFAVSQEIVGFDNEIHRLKEQIKRLQKKRDGLAAVIMQEIANGSSFLGAKFDEGTLSIATIRRPKPLRSRAELVQALKRADLGRLVEENYNENTLWSYTNGLIAPAIDGLSKLEVRVFDANTIVPESLRDDLSLNAKYEIRVTK